MRQRSSYCEAMLDGDNKIAEQNVSQKDSGCGK